MIMVPFKQIYIKHFTHVSGKENRIVARNKKF
jgi:hypothetical protein